MSHKYSDLIELFELCFYDEFNTRLVKGNDEPIFLPAGKSDIGIGSKPFAQVVFAHGYFTSALHEIAHWCLAGESRRQQIDYGYWYSPDGRTAAQQVAFQQAEIKPQAIESAFCQAAGIKFNVSCDNLSGDEFGEQPDHIGFSNQVKSQVKCYELTGYPARAEKFIDVLRNFYQLKLPLTAAASPSIREVNYG